jgi:ribosomal protein S18 acetylase RimI-like enzyme
MDILSTLAWHSMIQAQIAIRPFVAGDAMTWRTIRLEALANAPEAFGQTLEHAEKQPIDHYLQAVSGPFAPFAAFDGSKAVGTAGFYILGGPKMSHRGVLWGMYVSPTHRSLGIGRKLIESVIEHARDRVEQIHLNVVTTNTAAFNLYRSMGFVVYGIEPRALRHAGRDYDEAMMVLMIEPLRACVMGSHAAQI